MSPSRQATLAINGGTPVRSTPFPPWPFVTEEEKLAVKEVLDSSQINYHRGTKGIEFERAFADAFGMRYAVTCNSGTSALHMALAALGCGPGDEVIAPTFTFEASATAALLTGADPVFADLDPDLPTLSPEAVEAAITPRTKAIVVVHLYGHPCRMDEIMAISRKHNVAVVEDCAQCHGAEYKGRLTGSIGQVNAFSFCQTKIMTTGGEGGMVTTNAPELAGRAAGVRDFGTFFEPPAGLGRFTPVKSIQTIGFNYRLTEMQSAIGLALLEKLPAYVKKRRENMHYLQHALSTSAAVRIVPERAGTTCSPYAAFALLDLEALQVGRDHFVTALAAELTSGGGVAVRTGAYRPVNETPVLAQRSGDYLKCELPNSARLRERCLVFEVHPTIEHTDLDDVIEAVQKVESAYRA